MRLRETRRWWEEMFLVDLVDLVPEQPPAGLCIGPFGRGLMLFDSSTSMVSCCF